MARWPEAASIVMTAAEARGVAIGDLPVEHLAGAAVSLRRGELAFSIGELPFGLIERRLEGSRVYFEEQLTLLYERAFLVRLSQQIAGYLRLDLRVDQPIESPYPFFPDWNIPLLHSNHLDFGRRWLGLLGLRAANTKQRNGTRHNPAHVQRVLRSVKTQPPIGCSLHRSPHAFMIL
jgi:hypothetical protein